MAKFLGESGLTKLWELIKNLVSTTATSTLNSAKSDATSKANSALSNAKAYTDGAVMDLFNGEDDMHFKSEYMPSYVDDVLEFTNTVAAPTVGTGSAGEGSEVYYDTTNKVFVWKNSSGSYFANGMDGDNYGIAAADGMDGDNNGIAAAKGRTPYGGKIYVNKYNNKTYRWSGSDLVVISETIALGETSGTAYRGDRGKTAYDHAVAKGSAFASGLYKITTNAQGHVTAATAVAKGDITALGIPESDTHHTSSTVVGASNAAKANAAATNGNVWLNHIENSAVRSAHNIKGGGATTVVSDANGVITISSTDTNTHYASGTKVGASNTAQSNAAANGTVYLNHIENGAVKDSHAIKSGGATTVACDANGAITISSTVHTEITADDVVAKCV